MKIIARYGRTSGWIAMKDEMKPLDPMAKNTISDFLKHRQIDMASLLREHRWTDQPLGGRLFTLVAIWAPDRESFNFNLVG